MLLTAKHFLSVWPLCEPDMIKVLLFELLLFLLAFPLLGSPQQIICIPLDHLPHKGVY